MNRLGFIALTGAFLVLAYTVGVFVWEWVT